MADSTVRIGADLSELRRELAKLPNMSGEAAQKTLIKVEKAVQKAERAAKASTKAISRAQKEAAKATEKSSKDATEGLKALFEMAGGSGEDIEKLAKLMEGLGSSALIAGAAALAVAAGFAVVAGTVAGIVKLVAAAEDLEESLEPFRELEGFQGLDPEVWASVQATNASLEVLGSIADQVVQTLGGELAPATERTSLLLVKLGLMGLDAFQVFAEGKGVLHELAVFMTTLMVKALLSPINALMKMVNMMGMLAGALGGAELEAKLTGIKDSWDSWTRSVAETAVDFYVDKASDSLAGLNLSTGDYDARARKLIATQIELGEQTDKGVEATKKAVEATNERLKTSEADLRAYEAEVAAIAKLAEEKASLAAQAVGVVERETAHRLDALAQIGRAERDAMAALQDLYADQVALAGDDALAQLEIQTQFHDQRLALEEEFATRRGEIRQAEADESRRIAEAAMKDAERVQAAYLGASAKVASQVVSTFSTLANRMSEENKKNAEIMFAVSKAAALSQIVIDTAMAVSNVSSQWAAYPPVAAALSAVAIGVGAAQGAIVASEKPTFHTGGLITGRGNNAPDEVSIRAQAGESVLNRRATQRLGERGVNDMNAGRSGVGAVVVVNQYKHRVFDSFIQDHLKLPSGTLGKALRGTAKVGQRSR